MFREVVSRVEPQVLEADAEAEVSLLLLFVPSQYWSRLGVVVMTWPLKKTWPSKRV